MKIIVNDDINMIIFLNKLYLNDIDFSYKDELEIYFQKLLKILKTYYEININGYYEINVYIDKNYGAILELKKEELEYFGYFDGEVDMQLIIHDSVFLYEVDDYFWITDDIRKNISLYKYNNKFYICIEKKVDNISFGKIIENSKIKYYLDNKIIIKEKNLINI